MNAPEANECLKAGDRYFFNTREEADRKLTKEQLGAPEQDGVLVQYRGVDILSIELDKLQWTASGCGERATLGEILDAIDNTLDHEAEAAE
jgi:hypothetical protein